MEVLKAIPVIVLIALALLAIYRGGRPIPEKKDQVPLPVTDRTYHGIQDDDEKSTADITFTHRASGDTRSISLYDDGVYEGKSDANDKKFDVQYHIHYYPFKIGLDLGWWGGIEPYHPEGDRPVDQGLRISPCRIAYGVLAPDLLIGTQSIGIGVSGYAPTGYATGIWKKVGIGGAWMADYHGGGGWMPYVSVTTSF